MLSRKFSLSKKLWKYDYWSSWSSYQAKRSHIHLRGFDCVGGASWRMWRIISDKACQQHLPWNTLSMSWCLLCSFIHTPQWCHRLSFFFLWWRIFLGGQGYLLPWPLSLHGFRNLCSWRLPLWSHFSLSSERRWDILWFEMSRCVSVWRLCVTMFPSLSWFMVLPNTLPRSSWRGSINNTRLYPYK